MAGVAEQGDFVAQDVRDDPILEGMPRIKGYVLLDPCLIYGLIGRGGMGSVYLARHLRLNIDVAVKCMRPDRAAQPDSWVMRFQREATLAASISHQNLVRAYDIRQYRDLHYLVMEYVHGENARQRCRRRGELSIDEAVAVIARAASGLAAAHQAGVVHRDIKPDNILISTEGQVKVADLGLAKALELVSGGMQATLHTAAMGTPQYMAPEQWEDARTVGPAADTYALGATLYFLLTGKDAHPAGSLREIMHRAMTAPFPDARALRADVTDELAAFVAKATAADAAQRFPDAGAFHDELQRIASVRSLAGLGESVVASWQPPNDPPAASVLEEAKGAISTTSIEDFPLQVVTPPETFLVDCPGCGAQLQLPATAAGRTGRCPHCQHAVTVPISVPQLEVRRSAVTVTSTQARQLAARRPDARRAATAAAATQPAHRPRSRGKPAARDGSKRGLLVMGGILLLVVAGVVIALQALDGAAKPFDAAAFDVALANCEPGRARQLLSQAAPPPEIREAREQQLEEHERFEARLVELQPQFMAMNDARMLSDIAESSRSELAGATPCLQERLETAIRLATAAVAGTAQAGQQQQAVDESRAALSGALAGCETDMAQASLAALTKQGVATPEDKQAVKNLVASLAALNKHEQALTGLRDPSALAVAADRLESELPKWAACVAEHGSDVLDSARERLTTAVKFDDRQAELFTHIESSPSAVDALGLFPAIEELDKSVPEDIAVDDRTAELRQRVLRLVSDRLESIQRNSPGDDVDEVSALLVKLDVAAAAASTAPSRQELETDVEKLLAHLEQAPSAASPLEAVRPALKAVAVVLQERAEPIFSDLFTESLERCRGQLEPYVSTVRDLDSACGPAQELESLSKELGPGQAADMIEQVTVTLAERVESIEELPPDDPERWGRWCEKLRKQIDKRSSSDGDDACSWLSKRLRTRSTQRFAELGHEVIQRSRQQIPVLSVSEPEKFEQAVNALKAVQKWSEEDSELRLQALVALGDAYWDWAKRDLKHDETGWSKAALDAYKQAGDFKIEARVDGVSLRALSLCQSVIVQQKIANAHADLIRGRNDLDMREMNMNSNGAKVDFQKLKNLYAQEVDASGVTFVQRAREHQQTLMYRASLPLE